MTIEADVQLRVQVQHLTAASAVRAGRFDIPATWPNFELVLKVAPVLAQRDVPESGLVLASVPVLVCFTQSIGAANALANTKISLVRLVIAWGADSTMRAMRPADWKFALSNREIAVPAYVSSHLRALAFYSALPVTTEVLRRWKAAQDQVLGQVELLESVFGQQKPVRNDAAVDMTGEQVLRHRDRGLVAAWCGQARRIAASSKDAYERAVQQWLLQQGDDDDDVDRVDA